MLAARDQENLVHARQTTAAAKPLNQGIRQLQPKTPGNKVPKTPFKVPLNDENDPLRIGGKTGLKINGKGNENLLQSTKKDVVVSKNAFVTPMGMIPNLYTLISRLLMTSQAPEPVPPWA
jgi:hypothetical protein